MVSFEDLPLILASIASIQIPTSTILRVFEYNNASDQYSSGSLLEIR